MNHQSFSFLILIAILFGCGRKASKEAAPEFTREVTDYTKDRLSAVSAPIKMTDITYNAGIRFTHETGAFGEKFGFL